MLRASSNLPGRSRIISKLIQSSSSNRSKVPFRYVITKNASSRIGPPQVASSSTSAPSSILPRISLSSMTSLSSIAATRSSSSSHSYKILMGGAAGLVLILMTSTSPSIIPEGESYADCAAAKPIIHTLYIAGSVHGKGLNETVVGVPKEVILPGKAGRIDSLAFGPEWVIVSKEGAIYVASGIDSINTKKSGPAAEEARQVAITLYEPKRGWFSSGDVIAQITASKDTIYARTGKGGVLYWKLKKTSSSSKVGEASSLVFDGPYTFPQLKGRKIIHVAAGPEHAVFVTQQGLALAVGENGDGRLGTGSIDKERIKTPVLMKTPEERNIVGAACGGTHTLLIDSEGGAYSCGADSWYQLGLGETWKANKDREAAVFPEPKKIRALEEYNVVGLAAGGNHSLFSVVYDGFWLEKAAFDEKVKTPARVLEAWAAGLGQYGQLADRAYVHLSVPKCIKDLRVMTKPDVKLPVIQVSCGENHSAALVVEAIDNERKQLERQKTLTQAYEGPPRASFPPPPPIGPITYRPQVYVWGHGLGAQLGTGKAGNQAKPTVPPVVNARLIDAVICGYDYTAFVQRVGR